MDLTQKHCVPCEGGTPPFTQERIAEYRPHIAEEWSVLDNTKLHRDFRFKNFKQAMAFVNQVAEIAEAEGHHPDISIFYNQVTIELWTHAVGGLSENDFIVAAKIDVLIGSAKSEGQRTKELITEWLFVLRVLDFALRFVVYSTRSVDVLQPWNNRNFLITIMACGFRSGLFLFSRLAYCL